jgi:hypothetical protein
MEKYSLFKFEKREGRSLTHRGKKIIPVSQALILRLPGNSGGAVWNRPLGVRVLAEDGSEVFCPVTDVTRQAQLGLLAAGFMSALLIGLVMRLFHKRFKE